MNNRLLMEYVTFAQYLNYTKAAKHLFMSQSTLHQHLARLEKEVGCKLVDIKNSTLTEAGEMFLTMVQPLMYDYERIEQRYAEIKDMCRHANDDVDVIIRILDMENTISHQGENVALAFEELDRSPDSRNSKGPHTAAPFLLVPDNQHSPQESLDKEIVDLSFFWRTAEETNGEPEEIEGYCLFPLTKERCAALTRSDHPLTQSRFLLKDLERYPFICSAYPKWDNYCAAMLQAIDQHDVHARVARVRMSSLSGNALETMFSYGDQIGFGPACHFYTNEKDKDPAVRILFPEDCIVELQPFIACRADAQETVKNIARRISDLSRAHRR